MAESLLEPNGALVKLTVTLGEPLSVPAADNGRLLFLVTGFPQCTALLRQQSVRCTGLVPDGSLPARPPPRAGQARRHDLGARSVACAAATRWRWSTPPAAV